MNNIYIIITLLLGEFQRDRATGQGIMHYHNGNVYTGIYIYIYSNDNNNLH